MLKLTLINQSTQLKLLSDTKIFTFPGVNESMAASSEIMAEDSIAFKVFHNYNNQSTQPEMRDAKIFTSSGIGEPEVMGGVAAASSRRWQKIFFAFEVLLLC